jgi:futalosine hydrolase
MTVLLLTATAAEQAEVAKRMDDCILQRRHGRDWRHGNLFGVPTRLVETGIGLVNTAQALTTALSIEAPELVIQFGVAGAYSTCGLDVGDVGIADREIYGDLGVRTATGWQGAEIIGIPTVRLGPTGAHEAQYYNEFTADRDLVRLALAILDRDESWPADRPSLKAGPFITVQECSGTKALGDERARRFNAICENMEGAAVAHLCVMERLPFLEIRGISNLVEDRDRDRWDLKKASARAQNAVTALLEARCAGEFQ